ncbi:hypothetical protein [Burkholderia vietnamiensis]|uniref:hypothetical protein n=1 Tax=Burkholderia vietnamiensis TaxID=60552 RepID=UPI0015941A33|nr:hypothetical protein [Burkholderia vietnamiensis]
MTLDAQVLQSLTRSEPGAAWKTLVEKALDCCSPPVRKENASNDVAKRDREIGALDHFLSTGGWDLWQSFGDHVERTSDRLARWWGEQTVGAGAGKAILILDGLSLRELPWLLQGAEARGFALHTVSATASEVPGETNEFARALGFSARTQLQNNGGGLTHRLTPTCTESVDYPWKDCSELVDAAVNWVFWHHWPDSKLHDGAGAGQGLDQLTRDAAVQLTSDDFWDFVERLATGRRLVITSDHGYAATGNFPDAEGDVGQYLKNTFKGGRSKAGDTLTALNRGPFIPPVALALDSPHGPHLLALGRWKWKSQGGYPTLAHGGLSLLEVLSPFVELTK